MISKKTNTVIFWVLQFIGWGFITTANIWVKIFLIPEDKVKGLYFFFEGLLFLFLGITLTTLFRNYLKKIDFVGNQTGSSYLKAFKGFVITSLAFSFFILVCAHFIFIYIHEEPNEWSMLTIFSTTLNIAIFVFFWGVIYAVVKSAARIRRNKLDRLKLEASLKESQLNTLKGQLNPHFMFNSLNNIRGLMLEDVDKSREMLTRLSEMLRYSLNVNKVDAISIEEELQTVENYIALSKIQLEDRLEYQQEIKQDLIAMKIPPMVLQMLVENAIKHGVSAQKNGGKIKLIVTDNNEEIILQVNNTGTLVSDSTSTRIGLENIKKRLKLVYGEKASFTLQEQQNEVQAIIKIPVS